MNYQSGFANHFATEAIPHTLPQGRNSPQRVAHGLYAELISGAAFTAPREHNLRTWVYRRQPSVVVGAYTPYSQPNWCTAAAPASPPNPMRWSPVAIKAEAHDFVDGLSAVVANGDPDNQIGMAALQYTANQSMQRALINADGELLIVPQQGALSLKTELGLLTIKPGQFAVIPRGIALQVLIDEPVRGYVCENYGAPFRLPELGPIGSNGLANPRDFLSPVAAFDIDSKPTKLIKKFGGTLWQAQSLHSPFNVVAWHGNLAPYQYDCAHFNTLGTVSFDHPDPSIFTVLTSASDTPGTANCDFVIFPPRWAVAEDTFRPPWFHRNTMSEFMGLITGQYDAKAEGFQPGGMSLHNQFVPHGPDSQAFTKASQATLAPHKLDNTLAFMFESRWRFKISPNWLEHPARDRDYANCWRDLTDNFLPE